MEFRGKSLAYTSCLSSNISTQTLSFWKKTHGIFNYYIMCTICFFLIMTSFTYLLQLMTFKGSVVFCAFTRTTYDVDWFNFILCLTFWFHTKLATMELYNISFGDILFSFNTILANCRISISYCCCLDNRRMNTKSAHRLWFTWEYVTTYSYIWYLCHCVMSLLEGKLCDKSIYTTKIIWWHYTVIEFAS